MISVDSKSSGSSREGAGSYHQPSTLPLLEADMRKPLFTRQPLSYRVGSSTLRVQTKFVTAVSLIGCGALLLLYVMIPSSRTTDHHSSLSSGYSYQYLFNIKSSMEPGLQQPPYTAMGPCLKTYNSTYPLTQPILSVKRGITRYRIGIVADLDTDSKDPTASNTWISYFKKGYLELNKEHSLVKVYWDPDLIKLSSKLSYGGRGLELSELVVYNGKLYTVDDRTGVVYSVDPDANTLIPWVMLTDGDGNNEKGFKCEWATVRDGLLYIGGLGKEWTTSTGDLVNHNPQWIKIVDPEGHVVNLNWTDQYVKVRAAVDIHFPGYMIHEAVCWSSVRKEWLFLPRRASTDRYDETSDEHRGTDLMLTVKPDFTSVVVSHVGDILPTHGFSSFKFIPDTNEELIVALKSEEVDGTTASYIMAFNRQGNVLMKETKIGDYKFEGIEFI